MSWGLYFFDRMYFYYDLCYITANTRALRPRIYFVIRKIIHGNHQDRFKLQGMYGSSDTARVTVSKIPGQLL